MINPPQSVVATFSESGAPLQEAYEQAVHVHLNPRTSSPTATHAPAAPKSRQNPRSRHKKARAGGAYTRRSYMYIYYVDSSVAAAHEPFCKARKNNAFLSLGCGEFQFLSLSSSRGHVFSSHAAPSWPNRSPIQRPP